MYSRYFSKAPPTISIPWYTKVPGTPVKQDNSANLKIYSNALKFEPISPQKNSYSGKHSNTLEVLLNSNAKTLKDPSSIVNKMTAFEVHSVICPGGEFECPDDMTCCKMETGQWGCCPFSHAVCCSDGLHCCPRGHRCDLREGKCDGESSDPIDLIELLANRRPTNWDLKQIFKLWSTQNCDLSAKEKCLTHTLTY